MLLGSADGHGGHQQGARALADDAHFVPRMGDLQRLLRVLGMVHELREEVAHLARLARIDLTDDELDQTKGNYEILVGKIQGGWMEFDATVATPDLMRDVGKLGKLLGPRGLMPSPKTEMLTILAKATTASLNSA